MYDNLLRKLLISCIFIMSGAFSLPANAQHYYFDDALQVSPLVVHAAAYSFGMKGKTAVSDRLCIGAIALATDELLVQGLKHVVDERRPDDSDLNSFPSGHSARAFCGASLLFHEYKNDNMWVACSGYALATLTGVLRVCHDRHYTHDVLAGAAIGMASTEFAYWIFPKLKQSRSNKNQGPKYKTTLIPTPYYIYKGAGMSLAINF